MKASELIKQLQALSSVYGDLPIKVGASIDGSVATGGPSYLVVEAASVEAFDPYRHRSISSQPEAFLIEGE